MQIQFILNNEPIAIEADPAARLIDIIRLKLGLTGTKEGCGEGECGACSVLADGLLLNSCITPVANVSGKHILTIEGYAGTDRYKIIKKAFEETGAVQCGFCTPGMIMATEALLSQNHHPDENQIRDAISGNLCRCTGYQKIIEAIRLAGDDIRNLRAGGHNE